MSPSRAMNRCRRDALNSRLWVNMANKVTIYTTMMCPYCTAAKRLLDKKGADVDEIDVTFNPSGRREMTARAKGQRSVPQIFIGETHVGGCDDLFELEEDGELDGMLAG